MKNIDDIDANLKIETSLNRENIKFYNVLEYPFKIYGVFMENGKFRRIPEKIAASVSEGVHYLHAKTSGGRIRFKTDSCFVAINVSMDNIGRMPHCSLTGSAGFDLYADNNYVRTFIPPYDIKEGYEGIIEFDSDALREITINFPLYSEVKEVYIGLNENSAIHEAMPYKNENPVVYYGSSITQGSCASRPGRCYQNIISRRFNLDYINLGFSGNAKAEDEIISYIKNLDMSLFVYDYDHNAPGVEYLKNTHEKMFKEIRNEKPDIPVIMLSRPKYNLTKEEEQRRQIIEETYNNAVLNGDKNVYFIDGKMLTQLCENEGTVDDCHPTDLGFASMAKALGDVMEKIDDF